MTLSQDIATKARHRGLTPWQLVQKIGRLERALDRAKCDGMDLATRVSELAAERADLEGRLDQTVIELADAHADLAADRAELLELRAFKANILAVNAPAGSRDIDPDDAPTHPQGIPVAPLWVALRKQGAA
ncbi:hypothetical protein [Streptomyces pacificus]|uniref:Uncharacterized protein n=1 Tax=Streptomyces pacificus TaxID=2705029 RepID=A0A6A0AN20_9ACTN|nr:hypothetical protein [Streptomyces pacificus]GFH34346.1 hypothetical protein SCWH03_05600 [Streptomyces pacificus]